MRMTRHYGWVYAIGTAACALMLAGPGLAQRLPKLPAEFTFPSGDGSPGAVSFRHETHVDEARPNCTSCHPRLFKILAAGTAANGLAMAHAEMERGAQCGSCHNGKAAFGPDSADNCPACHTEIGP